MRHQLTWCGLRSSEKFIQGLSQLPEIPGRRHKWRFQAFIFQIQSYLWYVLMGGEERSSSQIPGSPGAQLACPLMAGRPPGEEGGGLCHWGPCRPGGCGEHRTPPSADHLGTGEGYRSLVSKSGRGGSEHQHAHSAPSRHQPFQSPNQEGKPVI